jgi:hypothetical protein
MERLERALALFMAVAWRIARLMRLGRTCPDLDAAVLFERDEWRAAERFHQLLDRSVVFAIVCGRI